jgi:hypothetical protein
MQSFKETTSTNSAAHGSELLHRRIKRQSLLLGLWVTPVACLVGALSVNVLTARVGWQTQLVLLAMGALAGLFALAARRLLLTPQGKAVLVLATSMKLLLL